VSRIFLSPPDVGPVERRLLLDAFDSNWIAPLGPHVDAFEREIAARVGVPHAVALSSGTAALHLGLIAAGVQPGDRVITSTLTFAATANAAVYAGALPVFVDVSPDTWALDPDLLEEELALSHRRGTRVGAVMPVDLYGQCADYDRIVSVANQYGVPVVADAAEGLGAVYKGQQAGSLGTCAAFSFNGNKIITTSGGGMLVSRDAGLVARARHLASQARQPVSHYEHFEIGYNYRLSNLLAAVGRGQLAGLSGKIAQRRQIRERYVAALGDLPGVTFMPEAAYGRPNAWLTCVLIDPIEFGTDREQVRRHLDACDIEARAVWKPLHAQRAFTDSPVRRGHVAEGLFEQGLCLPSGSALSVTDQRRVIGAIEEIADARQPAAVRVPARSLVVQR
jgi:dTDP-4-amino-4,6-dideoxygalactose transaminase